VINRGALSDTKVGSDTKIDDRVHIAHDGVLATMHESQITKLIGTNVTGTIILTKYLLRPMLVSESGRILNIASILPAPDSTGLRYMVPANPRCLDSPAHSPVKSDAPGSR